ncbi:PEP-CTERM sorting domain-containing protein [Akkermansia muciniphila]|uniref:PEP-CTERM sorting domain-containing protein n=2 Tax=Akkermansia muciniphila TaxID=239935 RepID=UPI001177B401|nr:PEP-CTERM sorting domain-containing protein [Akkermansia muciniphila]QQR32366.1 hypothetical protein I5Q85_06775 [Akkermansia muciniphila]
MFSSFLGGVKKSGLGIRYTEGGKYLSNCYSIHHSQKMKKTLASIAIAVCCSVPALASPGSLEPSDGTSYAAGTATTTEGIALGKNMTFGSLSQSALPGSFIPYGGNFYASDYTISLWLDTSSLTEGTQTTLFGYYGSNAGQSYGANALYLTSDAKLGMGDGNLNTSTGSFSQNRGDVSEASVVLGGGLLNVTLAATGANQSQSVDVYVNGSLLDTLSYNGNMNGNRADIQGWINPNLTWGGIQWTDAKLSAEQIAGFAGLQVPEPASASLGILGLAVLMMRRRS